MKDIKLVYPGPEYLQGYLGFCREMKQTGITYFKFPDPDAFDDWKDTLFERYANERQGIGMPEGWVPSTAFWLVQDGEFLGACNIRHHLTPALREFGGHIGYAVKPSRWRQGYGALQLHLALPEAKQIGIERALVTCDVKNTGSARVIEKNGGVLEGIFDVIGDGIPRRIRRYWIDL